MLVVLRQFIASYVKVPNDLAVREADTEKQQEKSGAD